MADKNKDPALTISVLIAGTVKSERDIDETGRKRV
jgi:hypothetical protein